jgi:hypothetical protein
VERVISKPTKPQAMPSWYVAYPCRSPPLLTSAAMALTLDAEPSDAKLYSTRGFRRQRTTHLLRGAKVRRSGSRTQVWLQAIACMGSMHVGAALLPAVHGKNQP